MVGWAAPQRNELQNDMQEQPPIERASPVGESPVGEHADQESLMRLSWVYDLYRLGAIIGGASDGAEFQQEVVEQIVRGLGATSGSLALIDDEKQTMFVAACAGLPRDIIGQPLNLGGGVLGWVATNAEPLLLIGDIAHDERFNRSSIVRDHRLGSAIVWPLKWRGRVTGILSVNREESTP